VQPSFDVLGRYLEGGGRLLVLLDPTIGQGGLTDTGLVPGWHATA